MVTEKDLPLTKYTPRKRVAAELKAKKAAAAAALEDEESPSILDAGEAMEPESEKDELK